VRLIETTLSPTLSRSAAIMNSDTEETVLSAPPLIVYVMDWMASLPALVEHSNAVFPELSEL
jgi:hypothetical protein